MFDHLFLSRYSKRFLRIYRWRLLPLVIAAILCAASIAAAQHDHGGANQKPAMLLPGMGEHHHPISTKSAEAQKFFDQGMTLTYGFNRPEALRSFKRAAELDPDAVMPLWGIALVKGPYINMDGDEIVDPKGAYEAIEKALSMIANAPEHEQAYVKAMARRCSKDEKAGAARLEKDYAEAMRDVMQRYPDDLDAATLYAESLMIPSRWKWFSADGKPAEGMEECISVLESVLRRDPNHAGANHYYIHAVESSPTPERALPSAARLMGLVPGIGHLVHMPGHIFLRTGDFDLAAFTNDRAVKADKDYIQLTGAPMNGYTMGYYPHNIHFVVVARATEGKFDEAMKAADELVNYVTPGVQFMPEMVDYFMPMRLLVLLRFQRWDDLLKTAAPDERLLVTKSLWHYARAFAFAAKGDARQTADEQRAFEAARKKVPAGRPWSVNVADNVLLIAAETLEARLAKDQNAAIEHLKKAVAYQDAFGYDEPPPWYYPVRESLGAALLRAGRAAEAEAVFREDIRRNPRNPRSLFGLMEALKAQKKIAASESVGKQFLSAWKYSQAKLRIEDM